ncbi:HD domain-containing phosphohydrolase [Polynucleobacter sp. AP-Titi-500A-B4]|uniref:HD domain-containing phosphohydrolase n=1 Tax=Polynucleobacter sp. AP-Titi-500A-B4 TaxID=2576923 RepID=UPI001BFDE0F9|nr:HD domain-containing phosphohydrolase [Polynucleobacter sp. AP-Titi-500A-B4]QWE11712.1 PAS domain S-box protein [Polynucleobacter sp. AP-Titi-500A-B4]
MELFNFVFYISMAVVTLVIFLGAISHKEFRSQYQDHRYWPAALILMALSCFGFIMAGLQPFFFLSLGNTSLIFSSLAIFLFIKSWDPANNRFPYRNFWIAFVVLLVAYEFLRIYASFNTRVYFVASVLGILSLLGLVELFLIPKGEQTRQHLVLKIAFCIHLAIVAIRVFGITLGISGGTSVSTIYQEGALTGMLRALGVASNLLVYLGISNILLERAWRKEEKKSANNELRMLSSLNALAHARDNETGAHIIRTKAYVRRLATRMRSLGVYADELTVHTIEKMCQAAPLHDIGKVGIPDSILYKKGGLTKEEWGVMKTHTLIGETVLSSTMSQFPEEDVGDVVSVAIQIADGHHEQWDGSGYPRGLSGQAIPISARIMSLADMYDALISERVYKKEWTHDQAVAEIISKKGTHFDPAVVEAFVLEQDHFKEIAQKHKDDVTDLAPSYQMVDTVEQKLRNSEERFKFLFKYSPIGMAMVDHTTGDFVEVNDALLEYTQYTKEEFLKLSFWDITPKEYEQQEQEQIETLNKTGSFGPNYKEYIRKDGTRFPISIRGFILADEDGRKLVWGVIEDLSKQVVK